MATLEHATLTDPNLHNPKGFDTASNDTKLVKDATGALVWEDNASISSNSSRYGEIITADGSGSSDFGQKVWKDIIGTYQEDVSGPTRPTKAAFKAPCDAWSYGTNDAGEFFFHIPHDYAVGTDLFIHVHWGHNGTSISGNMVWNVAATVSQRSAGIPYTPFSANVANSINSNTISGAMNITNFPQHCHAVEEIQLSSSTPTASQLDTADIEVDGIIIVHIAASTVPSIGGGTPNNPYLFTLDIHYQADIEGTKNKDPNFYA